MGHRLIILSATINTVLMLGLASQGAIAEEAQPFPVLTQWQFQAQSQTLEFRTSFQAQPSYFTLREPSRVVVDIKGMSWEQGSIQRSYDGQIAQIRVAEFTDGVTRFVLETTNPAMVLRDDVFTLRSQPANNNQTLWQLSLGGARQTPRTSELDTDTNVNIGDKYPPALLPPMIQDSVTVPPPPIPNNLRK